MGWGNRRWQNDEEAFDYAHEVVLGVSDDDAIDALLAAVLLAGDE